MMARPSVPISAYSEASQVSRQQAAARSNHKTVPSHMKERFVSDREEAREGTDERRKVDVGSKELGA